MDTRKQYNVQDIITGNDSEFDRCQDSSVKDPDYTPINKDMESNVIWV